MYFIPFGAPDAVPVPPATRDDKGSLVGSFFSA